MKKLTVLSIFFLLVACLPAPQTQATVAPTVTLTPTATPTLTPMPTATISPQVTALKEEIREFVPAETFVYVTNLSEVNLEVNPKADKEAIYWDFVGTLVSSLKLTDNNKAILEEVLNDESMPQEKRDSWSDLSNNSDKKLRLELMQAFLQKSGGRVDITTIGYEVLIGADLNQPPIFESMQVALIPEG